MCENGFYCETGLSATVEYMEPGSNTPTTATITVGESTSRPEGKECPIGYKCQNGIKEACTSGTY